MTFPAHGSTNWDASLKAVHEALVLDVTDYGIVGDGSTVNSTATLNAALNSASKASAVYWPPGTYLLNSPLAATSFVTHYGATYGNADAPTGSNPRAVLQWTTGNALKAGASQNLTGLTFRDLCLVAGSSASDLIDLTAGGLIFSSFDRCLVKLNNPAGRFVYQTAGSANNLFNVEWRNCRVERLQTHTVSAFDIAAAQGTNHLRFVGGWWHSHGCTSTPFFKANYSGTGVGMTDFTFEDLIGEQNAGGLLHLLGLRGGMIRGVRDFDLSTLGVNYADDVFKIANGSGGGVPSDILVDNIGIADGTMTSGKYHLNVAAGVGVRVGRVKAGLNEALVSMPINGRVWEHNGGFSRSLRTVGSNYSVLAVDDVVMATAGAITITLPDPAALLSSGTMPYGRFFTVKNRAASAVTVASAGTATIDGTATLSLAAQAKSGFITDGTNWYTI